MNKHSFICVTGPPAFHLGKCIGNGLKIQIKQLKGMTGYVSLGLILEIKENVLTKNEHGKPNPFSRFKSQSKSKSPEVQQLILQIPSHQISNCTNE